MEETATQSNQLLDQAIDAVKVLQGVYNQLRTLEIRFTDLGRERHDDALHQLGEVQSLGLKEVLESLLLWGRHSPSAFNCPGALGGNFGIA